VTPLQLFRLFSTYTLFAGGTADNLSGTYSRTGTTVTVTATAHGHLVGHRVYLDFTTGTAVDGGVYCHNCRRAMDAAQPCRIRSSASGLIWPSSRPSTIAITRLKRERS
jgi:hypothetical protein